MLEGFAACDHAHAAGTFVYDGGEDGVCQVGSSLTFSAAVDQSYATVVAVEHLIAGEVDGVVIGMCQLGVDEGRGTAVFGREITAIVGRQFLFDDVGLNGDAQMIGLPGKVGSSVVIDSVYLKAGVAGITP